MIRHQTTPAAYRFWLRTAQTLAEVESFGVRVDKDYLERAIASVGAEAADLESQMVADPDFRLWRKRFGEATKPGSYTQLKEVAYRDLGLAPKGKTASGKDSGTASDFDGVDIPLIRHFFSAAKLKKALGTYLLGIQREMVQHADGDWYIHCSYNLNSVVTFRSSASAPNWQNVIKRNPRMAEIVRRCYVARPGCQLGEVDYGQIEVRIPCPYTDDPTLMAYVCDPTRDMHYDMACQLFKLDRSQVTKDLRNAVKSAYVFATFYGSYYGLTAKDLWEYAGDLDGKPMTLKDSPTTLHEHLASKGIRELGDVDEPAAGTWAAHVKSVDDDFWGSRFKVYAEWKRRWYDAYCREGGFSFLTGFAVHAAGLDKKQVCNSPIQGSGFHCLAWSMNELHAWLKRRRMKSRVIGEIHDSINLDLDPAERDDVLDMATRIMEQKVKTFAPWLNIPLIAEPEVAPIDGSWYDIRALKLDDGRYLPSDIAKWEKAFGPWDKQVVA